MSHLLLVGHTHSCKLTLGNDCAVRPSVTIRLDTSQVGKRDSARVWVLVVAVRRNGRAEVFVDRKYSHRGYRDTEKSEKKDKSHDRKPPAGGPRGADQFGPRTPRMVGTVTRARCANCGAVLTPGFDLNGTCPKCQAELHCCKQCRFFDSGAQFECTQPIQERISPKDAKNSCTFYEFRMTIEKDTAPTSYTQPNAPGSAPPNGPPRHTDARQAFENLFKK